MAERREGSTRWRDIARESLAQPLPRERIDSLPPCGSSSCALDLSGLSLRFAGLNRSLLAALRGRFPAFLKDPSSVQRPLDVSVHRDPTEYYVQPERRRPEGYYRLRIVHAGGIILLVTYSLSAWIDVAASRGGIALGTGEFDPPERALENFCRVATAWLAVERGGFLIHGASIVREGRGYVFFGKSASGKSTLARLSTEGRVVSDDLTLVLPGPAGLSVAGTPFRGTYREGGAVVGMYPLAGMFRLVQDTGTFVEKPREALALAEFIANLPFVNDALHEYPGLLERLGRAAARVPLLFLHFEAKPGFWEAVDASLPGGGASRP